MREMITGPMLEEVQHAVNRKLWIAGLTYEEVETQFRIGSLTQVERAEYQRIWRNSTYRYSSLAEQYQEDR